MFILSAVCPPVGMQVEVELNIPAFDLVPRECQLLFTGRVVRIEVCYRLMGFAVAGRIESEQLEDDAKLEDDVKEEEHDKKKLQSA
jgi:hypothetical protein